MKAALLAVLLVPLAPPARAWEARADQLELRLDQLELEGRSTREELARQTRRPGWVSRSRWVEADGRRRVYFGVGAASGIGNTALRTVAAEDRARAQVLKLVLPQRSRTAGEEEVSGALRGAAPVDWYLDRDGVLYALVAMVRPEDVK